MNKKDKLLLIKYKLLKIILGDKEITEALDIKKSFTDKIKKKRTKLVDKIKPNKKIKKED